MRNLFAYRRTPSPNGEPLHLKQNPFSYTEANRLKVHTVAFSEVLLYGFAASSSVGCRLHGACFVGGSSPRGSPLRLLRGSSLHGDPLRLHQGTSPPGDHCRPGGWCSLQSLDLAISKRLWISICALQDAPPYSLLFTE